MSKDKPKLNRDSYANLYAIAKQKEAARKAESGDGGVLPSQGPDHVQNKEVTPSDHVSLSIQQIQTDRPSDRKLSNIAQSLMVRPSDSFILDDSQNQTVSPSDGEQSTIAKEQAVKPSDSPLSDSCCSLAFKSINNNTIDPSLTVETVEDKKQTVGQSDRDSLYILDIQRVKPSDLQILPSTQSYVVRPSDSDILQASQEVTVTPSDNNMLSLLISEADNGMVDCIARRDIASKLKVSEASVRKTMDRLAIRGFLSWTTIREPKRQGLQITIRDIPYVVHDVVEKKIKTSQLWQQIKHDLSQLDIHAWRGLKKEYLQTYVRKLGMERVQDIVDAVAWLRDLDMRKPEGQRKMLDPAGILFHFLKAESGPVECRIRFPEGFKTRPEIALEAQKEAAAKQIEEEREKLKKAPETWFSILPGNSRASIMEEAEAVTAMIRHTGPVSAEWQKLVADYPFAQNQPFAIVYETLALPEVIKKHYKEYLKELYP